MCVLRASGAAFQPEAFLRASKLVPCAVFHKGEPRSRGTRDSDRREKAGFTVDVSASWLDLPAQVSDACAFLDEHRDDMARLADGIEDLRLDFPVTLRIDREEVWAQFHFLPHALVSRAGELGLGLELSVYPAAADDVDAQAHPQAEG